jgi:kynurenine formamidase
VTDKKLSEPFTESTYIEFMQSHSNWGRWGAEDQMGTLNLITNEKVREAAGLIQSGERVSCSRLIEWAPKPSSGEAPIPPLHFMLRSGENAPPNANYSAYDWIGFPLHGLYLTHLDAHSHVFWDQKMYNGRSSSVVMNDIGAKAGSVELAMEGMSSRGVLLDVARARGLQWLEDDDAVSAQDLESAEKLAGTQVEPGDIVFVRTGYGGQRRDAPTQSASTWSASKTKQVGLAPECASWLWDRSPAVLASDSGTDSLPSKWKSFRSPIHAFVVVNMGMWIVDGCDLERLSERAQETSRYSFFTTIAPLRLKHSTGSPVNPIAIF